MLTTGCNTAFKNLSSYIENVCVSLSHNIEARIKDTAKIINNLNANGLPENMLLVSFGVVNMFPNIYNMKGIQVLKIATDSRQVKEPSTECITK